MKITPLLDEGSWLCCRACSFITAAYPHRHQPHHHHHRHQRFVLGGSIHIDLFGSASEGWLPEWSYLTWDRASAGASSSLAEVSACLTPHQLNSKPMCSDTSQTSRSIFPHPREGQEFLTGRSGQGLPKRRAFPCLGLGLCNSPFLRLSSCQWLSLVWPRQCETHSWLPAAHPSAPLTVFGASAQFVSAGATCCSIIIWRLRSTHTHNKQIVRHKTTHQHACMSACTWVVRKCMCEFVYPCMRKCATVKTCLGHSSE